jgi:RNA polymerase sigma-70 factor (ECF subfamily)
LDEDFGPGAAGAGIRSGAAARFHESGWELATNSTGIVATERSTHEYLPQSSGSIYPGRYPSRVGHLAEGGKRGRWGINGGVIKFPFCSPDLRLHDAKDDLVGKVNVSNSSPSVDAETFLSRIAGGDDDAMRRCLEVHGPLVWGIVRRQVSDHGAAEDLTQEIFTEIWKGASKHDPGLSSERGYIAMIARRRTIDWIRQRTRLPELAPLTEHMEIPAGVAAPGLMLDREILRHALESLSEETRRLFHLHFDRGMSHGEIAAETGLPLGSVKTALRRGLIEARVLLKRRLPVMTSEGGAP